MDTNSDLTGKLLIAMPTMGDPRFEQSVIFLAAHSDDGAMGLIINKPHGVLSLFDLVAQMDLEKTDKGRDLAVHFGGPVETERGFILHSNDYQSADSLPAGSDFTMSATQDVLVALSTGRGPQDALIALGYAGWGPGQLETEIASNGWLTCDANPALVFHTDNHTKWEASLATIGVTPLTLSSQPGHA